MADQLDIMLEILAKTVICLIDLEVNSFSKILVIIATIIIDSMCNKPKYVACATSDYGHYFMFETY